MAPSHHLNQCWLNSSEVLWHSFTFGQFHRRCSRYLFLIYEFENENNKRAFVLKGGMITNYCSISLGPMSSPASLKPQCCGYKGEVGSTYSGMIRYVWTSFHWQVRLTYKQLEIHMCVLNTVATDAMVLKHQDISIFSADQYPSHWTSFR